jgi:hypothetical protein
VNWKKCIEQALKPPQDKRMKRKQSLMKWRQSEGKRKEKRLCSLKIENSKHENCCQRDEIEECQYYQNGVPRVCTDTYQPFFLQVIPSFIPLS